MANKKIYKIWAIISEDEIGDQHILGFSIDGQNYPLVTSVEKSLDQMSELAYQIARISNNKFTLVEFDRGEDLKIIKS